MSIKKVVHKTGEREDFLGLLAFGSVVTNIVQVTKKMELENHNKALKSYANDLRDRYQNIIKHYQQLRKAYLSMMNVKEGLSREVSTLNEIINELRAENNRLIKEVELLKNENLKDIKAKGVIRRTRRVFQKKAGEGVTDA
ncbi:MAG: hypothetical protein HY036_09455 [Nitrospirae bacterium]|nr:hypothetical protein [Nitrospirota bacterium]MBI3352790.1 hypothetical protein [Nitrospirota bacterium]